MLLMQEPELMMLDEPVAGMSAAEREQTADLLKRISANRSIIIIEHDMEVVFGIAQKIAVLHQGELIAEGTPDEVRSNPEVRRVYLGHGH
jgi:urea transport system ATP-binding protein